jgi:hypothetical protein
MRSIYRTVYMQTGVNTSAIKNRLCITVVLFHCCNLIWDLRNNNYSLYSLQLMTVVSIYVCAIFAFLSYIVLLSKLAETFFFCWRLSLHKYDLLQFGGVVLQKSQICKTPLVKVDRNKYLTLNRCPLGNCE